MNFFDTNILCNQFAACSIFFHEARNIFFDDIWHFSLKVIRIQIHKPAELLDNCIWLEQKIFVAYRQTVWPDFLTFIWLISNSFIPKTRESELLA